MKMKDKSKDKIVEEFLRLRRRVGEPEALERSRKKIDESLQKREKTSRSRVESPYNM
ncbi:MAG: hypothetical protein JSU90_06715 [Nitrospiraceae bacterium]|nr:MAG: hypothetical protein JSU90_06715 [Nitrospiraceae bacterium]